MTKKLKERLELAFKLTYDLFENLDEACLQLDLPKLQSNRIASQVWCIVGARESYTKAIQANCWQGFSCSLKSPGQKQSVLTALDATREKLHAIEFDGLTETQLDLALRLLEHEVQHHGQLIRYVYGNGLSFPLSWSERYTV